MKIQIRFAERHDLAQILDVYQDAGLDAGKMVSLDEAEKTLVKLESYPYYKLFVAVEDGVVVGTFALLIFDNLIHEGRPSGVVEAVAVRSTSQCKGIGKAMMGFALDECSRHGCTKMALSSNEKRTAAHRFYESLGFVRQGLSFVVPVDTLVGQRASF